MPRRRFLGHLGWAGTALALGGARSPARAATHPTRGHAEGMGPDESLKRLLAGNERYVAQKPQRLNQTVKRRLEVAGGQHPFAVILGCADSRVAPEIVFDRGLGDLFVVRVAGNIADDAAIGSIEYAVEHLGTRLVRVLGHQECGAVAAALEASDTGGPIPGNLSSLVKPILPAVVRVKDQAGDRLDNAVRANVRLVVSHLRSSDPVLRPLVDAGKIGIVGARYDLGSGRVGLVA